MRLQLRFPLHVQFIIMLLVCIVPLNVLSDSRPSSYHQDFLITGYYSPEEGQCCYVKGGVDADKILNGQGHTAADGTAVYAGMIAAPPSYAFGTRIVLEGIGVFTVHDRGGAIQELADGVHRLDIWTGKGEEGLARALAVGLTSARGRVYPPGSRMPEQEFVFDGMPAPVKRLEEYLVHGRDLMALKAQLGDRGLSVAMLQDFLRETGYFPKSSTGFYGPETQEALAAFMRDHQLGETDTELTSRTAAHLLAAARRKDVAQPISAYVDPNSNRKEVLEAQRILRFLGYYKGRTTGVYTDELFASILKFQQNHQLVGDRSSPGAGRIGPLTMKSLKATWNRHLVQKRAQRYLARGRVRETLAQRGKLPDAFLSEGYSGKQVDLLQQLMADRGYFPRKEANGYFGPLTKQSVARYQVDRGIIASKTDRAAGVVGPSTLTTLREEELRKGIRIVRGQGWKAL